MPAGAGFKIPLFADQQPVSALHALRIEIEVSRLEELDALLDFLPGHILTSPLIIDEVAEMSGEYFIKLLLEQVIFELIDGKDSYRGNLIGRPSQALEFISQLEESLENNRSFLADELQSECKPLVVLPKLTDNIDEDLGIQVTPGQLVQLRCGAAPGLWELLTLDRNGTLP